MIEDRRLGIGEAKRHAVPGAVGPGRDARSVRDVFQGLLQHGSQERAAPSPPLCHGVERGQQLAIDAGSQHRWFFTGG
ncbi:hypothetical protein BES08_30835 (plasmid) [Novosphingobium resinovorum]|uniref:Uncharacterized protein n=1 Tax=Novosphingobium resinovorum TaxID=158500 RepID=A0A1D8AGL5_9SPHN|nr:hypothetical protein BES08_30835 [Novosphingobium resinovorum]